MQRLFLLARAGALCVLALLTLATVAEAQGRYGSDGYGGGRRSRGSDEAAYGGQRLSPVGLEFTLRGYVAAPDGVAIDGTGSIFGSAPDVEWDDLYDDGTGFGLLIQLPITLREARGGAFEFALGPLLAFDTINYKFDGAGVFGPFNELEDLEIFTALVGFHVRFRAGPATAPVRFYGGIHVAFGAATIDAVHLRGSGTSIEYYEETTTFAFEIQLRPGIAFQLHPKVQLNAFLLAGGTGMGPPDNGAGATPDAEPIINTNLGGGASVSLRF